MYMASKNRQWEVVKTEEGPGLKLFKVRFDHMRNPRNEMIQKMVILDTPDSANVVALTTNGQIVFVRQYRFGIKDYTIELPGGIVDPGEDAKVAAIRELREETGHTARYWHELGKIASNPVFMNGYIHHYVATEADKTAPLELDDGEDIDIQYYSIEETRKMLYKGKFGHPHTVSALVGFFNWYDKL